MADQPFINDEERPNLTINMEGKVGDLTVRELTDILGVGATAVKAKEVPVSATDKAVIKEIQKDVKDRKEAKEAKDQKDDHDRHDYPDNSRGASHF